LSGLKWNENDLNSMYTFFVTKRIVPQVLDDDGSFAFAEMHFILPAALGADHWLQLS